MTLYLCVTWEHYCHAVFDNIVLARRFCARHPAYHIVERELNPQLENPCPTL